MRGQQKLNLFDFTMVMVSFVIGMGIFRTPVNVASATGAPGIFFLCWIAGGIVALCGALTYAEIGSRYSVTGGYYKVFSFAYHPSFAFGINCIILISNAASLAGVALIGSEYILQIINPDSASSEALRIAIAIASILIFYSVNLLGLKLSARAQNILTAIKIIMIVALITPLFFSDIASPASVFNFETATGWKQMLLGFGTGLVAVSFTYGGYQQTINFGDEVKHPSKTIPRAIMLGIVIILTLYLLINYAYVSVIGFDALKSTQGIAAIMASKVFGNLAGKILSVFLFLSVLAYVNVLLMSNPRVMQAMSEDKVLPAAFARRSVKNNVLVLSLSVFASLCCLIVFWAKTFDEILGFTIFLDCFGMIFSAATIFKLRKLRAVNPDMYSMKLFPLMPLIFIIAYAFVAFSIGYSEPATALKGISILVLFIILYFFIRRKNINTV